MSSKVILLLVCLQIGREFFQTRQFKQLRLGLCWVLVDDDGILKDLGDIFFSNSSRRMVCTAVLSNIGPVVNLLKRLEKFDMQEGMKSDDLRGQRGHP